MTDEKSHTEAADPHGASQATGTRKNATCAPSGQEKRSGGHLDPITATRATAGQFGHPADGGLLPCPFCGSGPAVCIQNASFSGIEVIYWHGLHFVNCGTCGAEGAKCEDETDAVSAWNRRAIPAAQDGAEVELVTDADELRAELRRALAQIDSLDSECDRLHAQTEAARDEARRMDLARNQFLGERNMLAEALRDIQRGDMTNMMELTEAEAARARATWALRKIGEPVGDFRAERDALKADVERLRKALGDEQDSADEMADVLSACGDGLMFDVDRLQAALDQHDALREAALRAEQGEVL